MKSKWVLLVGIVLGLVAGFLTYQRLNQSEESVPVASESYLRLKPSVTLVKGDQIRWEDFELVNVPAEFEPLSSVAVRNTPQTRTWITSNDVRASQDLAPGSFLLTESLIDKIEDRFYSKISMKGRAVTIFVHEVSSVAYFIEPGSRVDVLVTFEGRGNIADLPYQQSSFGSSVAEQNAPTELLNSAREESVITKTLLQNMLVLATGSATTRNSYLSIAGDGYETVTFDATPEEAELLVFASTQAKGGINLVLRNPMNNDIEDVEDVDWNSVVSQ